MRIPIITPGQLYLHPELNEYLVVTYSNQGDIRFKGPGFAGTRNVESFLEVFPPVDPEDLTADEKDILYKILGNENLKVGWVGQDGDDQDLD